MGAPDILTQPAPAEAAADAGLHSLAGSGSILARTARGAGWVIGWRMTTRLLGVFSTLMLVRLLTPNDFGIVALAMSFFQGINSLSEVGVEEAIVRTDNPTRDVYDSGFTINVIRAVATSLIMIAVAVPLAHYFGNEDLVNVIYVLGGIWALSGFENIGTVDFRRFLAFNMEFKIKILPRLISIGVAVPAAFYWHSYWALVGAIGVSQILTVILSYTMHPYRPRFSMAGMRPIISFSAWMWVNSLIGLVGGRVTTVFIGRLFSTAGVGIYGVGVEVATLASAEIVAPLCRALFSGFAAARKGGDNGAETLLRVLSLMTLVTFPMSMGLSLVAYPIIKIGFGPEWLGAVPVVQILGVATTLTLFGSVSAMLFAAHAWLQMMAWMNALNTVLRVALVAILVPRYGLVGAAWAAAIIDATEQLMYLGMAIRRLKISVWVMLARTARPIIAVAVMAAVLAWLHLGWAVWAGDTRALSIHLAYAVGLGAVVYGVTLVVLWLAAGCPEGAETDALLMANRILKRV